MPTAGTAPCVPLPGRRSTPQLAAGCSEQCPCGHLGSFSSCPVAVVLLFQGRISVLPRNPWTPPSPLASSLSHLSLTLFPGGPPAFPG